MLRVLLAGLIALLATTSLSAQRVIDILNMGTEQLGPLVDQVASRLEATNPTATVRRHSWKTPAQPEFEGLGDIAIYLTPRPSAATDVSKLEPRWVLDTNQAVIGGVFPASITANYVAVVMLPASAEITNRVRQALTVSTIGVRKPGGMELGTFYLHPQQRAHKTATVFGFRIPNATQLHALSKQGDQRPYQQELNRLRDLLRPSYAQIETAKRKALVSGMNSFAKRALESGATATGVPFEGEKIKRILVDRDTSLAYPLYQEAVVFDEYDQLKFPVSIGLYKRNDKPKDTTLLDTKVEYRFWGDLAKPIALRMADTYGDGREVYLTPDYAGAIVDLRSAEERPAVRVSLFSGRHQENILSNLSRSRSVALLSDVVNTEDYYKRVGVRSNERTGASYLLKFSNNQYSLLETATDVNLGTTANLNASAVEVYELLEEELDLGARPLRVVSGKKDKVKSFLYYKPLAMEASSSLWLNVYAERSETVDGKVMKRLEQIGEVTEAHVASRPAIRLLKVRKGEREIAEAIAAGVPLAVKAREYKFFGKTYK